MRFTVFTVCWLSWLSGLNKFNLGSNLWDPFVGESLSGLGGWKSDDKNNE